MMTLFKLARIKSNPAHLDSYIDGCGYLACAGEIAVGKPATFGPPQPMKRGEAL
jgi:hypothetical protein